MARKLPSNSVYFILSLCIRPSCKNHIVCAEPRDQSGEMSPAAEAGIGAFFGDELTARQAARVLAICGRATDRSQLERIKDLL